MLTFVIFNRLISIFYLLISFEFALLAKNQNGFVMGVVYMSHMHPMRKTLSAVVFVLANNASITGATFATFYILGHVTIGRVQLAITSIANIIWFLSDDFPRSQ